MKRRFDLKCLVLLSSYAMVILFTTPPPLAQQCHAQDTRNVRRHVVAYGSYSEREVRDLASHFDMVILLNPGLADRIKSVNSRVHTIVYENVMAAHPAQPDWTYVNTHEEWFVHDADGHRLKNDGWCWHLMNPNSGWRNHVANRVRERLVEYPRLDGVFVDNCWPMLRASKWHIEVRNEARPVNEDGRSVTALYEIWKGPVRSNPCRDEVGVHGIYIDLDHRGRDYSEGGSYSGRTITLGTPLSPGTPVYLSYAAKERHIIKPPPTRVKSFPNDINGMLREIKAALPSGKILVANTGSDAAYLDTIDGMMREGFVSGTRTGDSDYPAIMQWQVDLKMQQRAVSNKRRFFAHSGTAGTSENGQSIRKKAMFCYVSHLLVFDRAYSSFGFTARGVPVTWYPEWDAPLGEPQGSYYLVTQGNPGTNLIANGSFEDGLPGWSVVEGGAHGRPSLSADTSFEGANSAHFFSAHNRGCFLRGTFIPVEPHTKYRLSAWLKGSNITSGGSWWRKLGVWGWWCDMHHKRLGQFSLLFPKNEGKASFDWTYLTDSQYSPAEAAYYQINRLGLAVGSRGEGWIDNLKFIEDTYPHEYIIFARNFSNGLVLLNMGTGYHPLTLASPYYTLSGEPVKSVRLDARQGLILLRQRRMPPS